MASAYHAPLYLSCSSLMANEPSVSLSHQRIQTHLPNSFLTGSRPMDACRTLYHLTGSFLSVEVKRRRTNFSSISGKFSCSLANGPEVVTACSWNELVLSSDVPVVVEFWTSWCGPCKMVSRLMNELANDYSGRIRCFRINADDYPQVAASNGVERIPTILVFKDAEKLERITGTLPKSVYVAAIQKSLSE
ncbi:thioredoxin M3, chloroplastic isoform X1 [Dendrobium catenatum]|uniref:Thioredoxin M3, chloroplastic n=1 Tax=Dendrobium catenatum TaxID=906689 RepID=A0A2I0W4G5_9ASPA|nr:thioredoxin M3, chloroplastic isoform X1 [Dendrobium catenatum]PKU70553.1 Thioredoxin M3, chloroplastic [Dendrobium catenatum]